VSSSGNPLDGPRNWSLMNSAVRGSTFLVPRSCSEFGFLVHGSRFGGLGTSRVEPQTGTPNTNVKPGTRNREL
jgi:hypothetical protein